MKRFLPLLLFALVTASCDQPKTKLPKPTHSVDEVMDLWHMAASKADYEGYFGSFTSDSSIFMGTDATERWTIGEFKEWAKPYFDRGSAWTNVPKFRKVYYNSDSTVAWFDEELATVAYGELRGSGVLVLGKNGWTIDHYNLAIPIPNDLAKGFIAKMKEYASSQNN